MLERSEVEESSSSSSSLSVVERFMRASRADQTEEEPWLGISQSQTQAPPDILRADSSSSKSFKIASVSSVSSSPVRQS